MPWSQTRGTGVASFQRAMLGLIIEEALGIAPGVVLFAFEGLDEERRDVVFATLVFHR